MKKNWTLPILAGVFFACIFPCRAHAQDYVYATGNPNFGVNYPIPGGYINVTNGNVHITVPLGNFKQRGSLPPIKINLEYDSRIWKINDNGGYFWEPNNVANSMAGWRLTTELEQETTSYTEYVSQYGSCGSGQPIVPTQDTYTDFTWTDGQGTQHTFVASAVQGLPISCSSTTPPPASASGYAMDGSGYYLNVVNDDQMTVYDNRGNEVYPARVDPNGNTVTINSAGTVTDSMGRTLLTTTQGTNAIMYNVLKEGGGTNTFTVHTEPMSVSTAFNQSAVAENNSTVTAIQSIDLPDGSSYSFTYGSGGYGEMTGITLPTRGAVQFAYINYLDSYNNYNRWISTETESGGSATFSPHVLSQCGTGAVGCQEQMFLYRPSGDSRVYTLTLNNGAWDGVTDTYQGSTKLMTVVNDYNFSQSCTNSYICTGAEYITASSSTVTLDDSGQVSKTVYSYSQPWAGKIGSVRNLIMERLRPRERPTIPTTMRSMELRCRPWLAKNSTASLSPRLPTAMTAAVSDIC